MTTLTTTPRRNSIWHGSWLLTYNSLLILFHKPSAKLMLTFKLEWNKEQTYHSAASYTQGQVKSKFITGLERWRALRKLLSFLWVYLYYLSSRVIISQQAGGGRGISTPNAINKKSNNNICEKYNSVLLELKLNLRISLSRRNKQIY